jgi:hypothetical protein
VPATPEVAASFDVASVNVRGGLRSVSRQVRRWKAYFAAYGFRGPLWVTEHGSPSSTRHQYDPAYRGGRRAQARYLQASLPALIRAGAAKVLVTLRDNLDGCYGSEGMLGGTVKDPPCAAPVVVRKPAFYAIRALVRNEIAR